MQPSAAGIAARKFDVSQFGLTDMITCGSDVRALAAEAGGFKDMAGRIVSYLYESLRGPDGERACCLARLYLTSTYRDLDPPLKDFVADFLGAEPPPATKALRLVATVGDLPEWNDPANSKGHRAIPLSSEDMLARLPMISQLVKQLGVSPAALLSEDRHIILDETQRQFNVFYVPEALGSPHIPDQEGFVIAHGVKSVLGFGGLVPTGDLFAVILFSKLPLPREVAESFRTVALSVKVALLPFLPGTLAKPSVS